MKKNDSTENKILGIIGNPLSHSLSPIFQNYLCKKYAPECVYIPFRISKNGLRDFFRGIRKMENLRGFNITIPFKEEACGSSDFLSDEAKKSGAVNTIVVEEKNFYGYNTDIYGILRALERELEIKSLKGKDAVLLGAGGAARAAVYALNVLKAKRVFVISRSGPRAAAVKRWAEGGFEIDVSAGTFEDIDKILFREDVRLIVNATPVGLKGEELPINLNRLDKGCKIFDMAYGINKTPVVNNALSLGMKAADGLCMLVYQGVKSFHLWTGKEADCEGVLKFLKNKAGYGKDISNR